MFDPITWGIWLIGLVILIVWVWMPVREFRELLRQRKSGPNRRGDPT